MTVDYDFREYLGFQPNVNIKGEYTQFRRLKFDSESFLTRTGKKKKKVQGIMGYRAACTSFAPIGQNAETNYIMNKCRSLLLYPDYVAAIFKHFVSVFVDQTECCGLFCRKSCHLLLRDILTSLSILSQESLSRTKFTEEGDLFEIRKVRSRPAL